MIFLAIESPSPDPVGFVLNMKSKILGKMVFRDPRPIVLNDDEDVLLGSPGEEMDLPLFRDRLDAIDEEIGKGEVELAHIDLQQGQFLLKVGLDPRIFHLGFRSREDERSNPGPR